MEIICLPYGPLASNMYLADTRSGCFIIDPSVYPDRIPEENMPVRLDAVLITHGHFDHINAVDKWAELYPEAKVYMSAEDFDMIKDPYKNGSSSFAEMCVYKTKVNDIDGINLDILKIIETPGHSKGSICLLFDEDGKKALFTGDTLFAGSVGRSDLYGGSEKELVESLKKLKTVDADVVVLPGHGPSSTMGRELKTNPFFNF